MSTDTSPAESERILLEGRFSIHPKPQPLFQVLVTPSRITCLPIVKSGHSTSSRVPNSRQHNGATGDSGSLHAVSEKGLVLKFADVTGCDCQKGQQADSSHAAFLCLYAYPHRRKVLSKKTVRMRMTVVLTFDGQETFGENFAEALRWKTILCYLSRSDRTDAMPLDVNSLASSAADEREYFVMINPCSGPGKAPQIFTEKCLPMLAEAGIKHQVLVTKRAGYGQEFVKTINLDQWYGIVIVSGDGLIYEVLNGLMQRKDWVEAIKTPLGCLPGGSGNALTSTLLYTAGEPHDENSVGHATFMLVKHVVMAMDLMAVDTATNKRLYSFLHIAWGLIADVDIESEKFRAIGNARFTVGAVVRIANLRKYRGRLSFVPADPNYRLRSATPQSSGRFSSFRKSSSRATSLNRSVSEQPQLSSLSQQRAEHPPSAESASTEHRNRSSESAARAGDERLQSNGGRSEGYETKIGTGQPARSDEPKDSRTNHPHHTDSQSGNNNSNGEPTADGSQQRPTTHHLPSSVSDPLPADWITMETDFVTVIATLHKHIAQDFIVAPDARMDDGLIHLCVVRHGVSRLELVQLMTAEREDRNAISQYVEAIPVKAFRLVPLSEGKLLTVDGERVEYGAIQAEVLPSIARVMAFPNTHTGV